MGTAGKPRGGSPLYYYHPDPQGWGRLFREWQAGRWWIGMRYQTGHLLDSKGRPDLQRIVSNGKAYVGPYINIVKADNGPKAKRNQSGGWRWYVCRPYIDEDYIDRLRNAMRLEPRWTDDGNTVKLFRVGLTP